VAKVAMLWPINAMFASYLPNSRTPESYTIEAGLNLLTDLLLRLHHDFDYLDEEVLARSKISGGKLYVGDEDYELLLIPPMNYLRASTVEAVEQFLSAGGRVLGVLQAPRYAFGSDGMVDVRERFATLVPTGDGVGAGKDFEALLSDRGSGAAGFVRGDLTVLSAPPGVERDLFAASLDEAIRGLIEPDVEISNPELFALHRRRDNSDIYFVVNSTFETQRAEVRIPGAAEPVLFDPTLGDVRNVSSWRDGTFATVDLVLPPVGSLFLITGRAASLVTSASNGYAFNAGAPKGAGWGTADGALAQQPIELTGPWTFAAEDDNAVVVKSWLATAEGDADPSRYVARDIDDSTWDRIVAGAWAYQLPAEPTQEWPIPVWYRISFDVDDVPSKLSLLIDGFSGDEPSVWLNGRKASATPARSRIDAQIKELDLTGFVVAGRNVLAIRLVLGDATCGLVDHIKLVGDFSVVIDADEYRIVAPTADFSPASWTEQGYPFLSGRGAYRSSFELPDGDGRGRIVLDIPMLDDAVEVEINGRRAGVRLWDPYQIDITELVRPGRNQVTVRVANTPANLLNGHPRPSGINGAPRLLIDAAPGQGVLSAATIDESRRS
jgi:hypothetical protein